MSDMSEPGKDLRSSQPLPESYPLRKQALKLFILAAVGLFAMMLPGMLLPQGNANLRMLGMNLFYYLLFIGLPCLITIRKGPGTLENMRPNPISLFSTIFIGVLAVLCVFFVNDIAVLWSIPFQKLGFNVNVSGLQIPADRGGLILCLFYAAVLPGIFEEMLFHGVILSAFERQGTRRAVLASALMFMLMHGSIIGMPGQFLLGVLIAELVVCCNSIYAGLIFHTIYNASAILIQYWQNLTEPAAPVEDFFAAIGGWGGVAMLLVSILFTGAMLRISVRAFQMRARLAGVQRIADAPRDPLPGREKALLAICIVLAVLLYAIDAAAMLMVS